MPEFIYKNERFNSKVNDFGDGYNDDDSHEVEEDPLLKKVIGLKRRYRDFGEYCDAMEIIGEYLERLIDKWGGKKRFKFLYKLGLITDYIPFEPMLKKTKYNKQYIEQKVPRYETEHFNNTRGKFIPEVDEEHDITFKFKDSDDKFFGLKYTLDPNRESVAMGIDAIQEFYRKKSGNPVRLSKKALKRRIRKRQFLKNDYVPIEQREKDYYRKVDAREWADECYDPNEVVDYKGTFVKVDEAEELEVRTLLKQAGFKMGLGKLSKKARKVVTRSEKKRKKEKKKEKKKGALSQKYLKQFSNGRYESFEQFTREMTRVVASDLRGD